MDIAQRFINAVQQIIQVVGGTVMFGLGLVTPQHPATIYIPQEYQHTTNTNPDTPDPSLRPDVPNPNSTHVDSLYSLIKSIISAPSPSPEPSDAPNSNGEASAGITRGSSPGSSTGISPGPSQHVTPQTNVNSGTNTNISPTSTPIPGPYGN